MNKAVAATVLVIEDDPTIRRFVRDAIRREGYAVIEAGTGAQGLREIGEQPVQLLLLDLGLPDTDGTEVIRSLRTWSQIPILILSARAAEQEKIDALDAGADDYLTKPFGVGELLARIRVLLRRKPADADGDPAIHRLGEVEVDLARQSVRRGDQELHLTQIEFRLLAVLIGSGGRVMTHRTLMKEVWGPGYAEQEHYLRIYVRRLRQKLEADPTRPRHLLTETGVGYRFQP